MTKDEDRDLLVECDAIISLIRYREHRGLSRRTIQEIDKLLPRLRRRTDEIASKRRRAASPSEGGGEEVKER